MKMNHDCIRDVLLILESRLTVTVCEDGLIILGDTSIEDLYNDLPAYSHEDIFYSLSVLDDAGYIVLRLIKSMSGIVGCDVTQITYTGHEFLNQIRDSSRWSTIKKATSAVRDYSLDAIKSIAEGVTAAAISAYFKEQ